MAGFAAVHPAEPLFVTTIVYVTLSPGLAANSDGVFVTLKEHCPAAGTMSNDAVPDDVPPGASDTAFVPTVPHWRYSTPSWQAVGHTLATVVWKHVSTGFPTHDRVTVAAPAAAWSVTPDKVTTAVSDAVFPDTGNPDKSMLVCPAASGRFV